MPRLPLSEEQRATTRRRILEAAQNLFSSAGIDAVSMRALGAQVGLTASALYSYFPAKIDLLRALWWDTLDELHGRMTQLSHSEPDPIEAIRLLGQTYVHFGLENPARFRVLFMTDQGSFAQELKAAGIYHDAYRLFRDRVAEAISQGRLHLDDPDLGAQMLWAGVHGCLNLTNSSASFPFVPPARLAAATLDALLAGMRAPQAQKAALPAQ